MWLRWGLFFAAALALGAAVTVAVECVTTGSLADTRAWGAKYAGSFALTALLYGAAAALLGALLGRLWAAGAVVSALALGAALADYFKRTVNGEALVLSDFGLASKLGQVALVAGELRVPAVFWYASAALLACTAVLFLLEPVIRVRGRARFLQLSCALVCAVSLFSGGFAASLGERFQVDVVTRLDPSSSHNTYGLTLSLWRDLVMQEKAAPEGYGEAYMRQVLSRIDELLSTTDAEPKTMPNVVVVLSESFFDPARLPNMTFDRDPVPNYHALQAEGVSGPFFSHYLGYGTGYVEIAMQTGLSGPDLGAGTNLCFLEEDIYQLLDSLAEQYINTGEYEAVMLHAYNDSLYNRTVTYPLLGYSRSLYEEDILDMGLRRPGGAYGGYYMNDGYFFQGVLEELQRVNEGGKRAFLFAITMENHQPFQADKFHGVHSVEVESPLLDQEELAILQVGVEGLCRADRALGELTQALRDSPEPTVVAFFGDHRPTLPMPDGETVYTKLGLTPGSDTTLWTEEQLGEVYSSDYLLWANDAAHLREQAGTVRPSGVTAFAADILKLTDWPVSRYWGLAELAAEAELVRTDLYFVSGDGTVSHSREAASLTEAEREILDLRDGVVYDAVYGKQYVTAEMNLPP